MTTRNEFVTVSELSVGFSEYRIKQSDALIGKNWTLNCENGDQYSLSFINQEIVQMLITHQNEIETIEFACQCNIIAIKDSIFFLDLIIPAHLLNTGKELSFSAIIDIKNTMATLIIGEMPSTEVYSLSAFYRASQNMPITAVNVQIVAARLNQLWTDTDLENAHKPTNELLKRRIQFRYSQNDLYEHIYLNENYYTWQCLEGVEKGLCDTDKCFYYKISENIYLFVWIEKIIPTLGVVIEDLAAERSHGKIYGYAGYESGQVKNFVVGSYANEQDID